MLTRAMSKKTVTEEKFGLSNAATNLRSPLTEILEEGLLLHLLFIILLPNTGVCKNKHTTLLEGH